MTVVSLLYAVCCNDCSCQYHDKVLQLSVLRFTNKVDEIVDKSDRVKK